MQQVLLTHSLTLFSFVLCLSVCLPSGCLSLLIYLPSLECVLLLLWICNFGLCALLIKLGIRDGVIKAGFKSIFAFLSDRFNYCLLFICHVFLVSLLGYC